MKLIFVTIVTFLIFFDLCLGQRRSPQQGSSSSSSSRSPSSSSSSSSSQSSPSSSNTNNNANRQQSRPAPRPQPDKDDDDDDDEDTSVPFSCPRSDGLYADPGNCKKFYLCGGFKAYSQSCPPSLYFDDKLKFCTFKTATLSCGPVAEEEMAAENAYNQDNLSSCDRTRCQLPNCFCSVDGSQIPGGLQANQVPQMVLIGFSGAVNELVMDQYKKVLGYSTNKFQTSQTKTNPNGCGIRATFFLNHEYTNYANVQWLAAHGHEIAVHSITHRLPETWWTDVANYSEWAEEMIGMREMLIKFGSGHSKLLTRENILGMRAPYVKPGGDPMFEMAHDFGLMYDTSIVAPRANPPFWPFTFDYKQPFDCYNANKKGNQDGSDEGPNPGSIRGQGGQRQKRDIEDMDSADWVKHKVESSKVPKINPKKKSFYEVSKKKNSKSVIRRAKRHTPYLGRALQCPTKAYPGLWEIPVNPLYNDVNTCPHADQCVFPSSDETDDSQDIVDFLTENFERHYTTNRAPFQLNFHVNWFTSKTKVRALGKFIDSILKNYPDAHFVTYQEMVNWMRDPLPLNQLNFKCPNATGHSVCNRPHTCVLKHYLDKNNGAASVENSVRTDTRYMALCQSTSCPAQYPWYNNHAGQTRNFKTIMTLVEEAVGADSGSSGSSSDGGGGSSSN